MLKLAEKKLEWDYNVPKCFKYIVNEDENCIICQNSEISKEYLIKEMN